MPSHTLSPNDIITFITQNYDGVIAKSSWGETALFYNPEQRLPNGVYFCTIKEKDGENDQHSQLDRKGVFRVSIGVGVKAYEQHFSQRPARPAKGQAVNITHDVTALNQLTPHPVYAWMSWVQILNPSKHSLKTLTPLIDIAFQLAAKKYQLRIKKLTLN